ncbi:UPAR/Ly6 domain-containing protein CG9338-like [Haematobia irritans]|uniref:UPAR/Ly6 domain-containing protein CG9338-like n=1 Tax=Haematobia irritans TaxID=7368 RepID=UPI003F50BCAB
MCSMKYLLALAIVATLANTAFATHCYMCTSLENSKCGDQFEPEENMKVDCSKVSAPASIISYFTNTNLNSTGCMKQTMETKLTGTVITRSCFFGDIAHTETGCKVDSKDLGAQLSCDVCTGNLCNGSTSMAPVILSIAAFFALARIFS